MDTERDLRQTSRHVWCDEGSVWSGIDWQSVGAVASRSLRVHVGVVGDSARHAKVTVTPQLSQGTFEAKSQCISPLDHYSSLDTRP